MTTIDNIMALADEYANETFFIGNGVSSSQKVKKLRSALRAALAQQSEPVRQVSWNLNYKDSTPKLNVMNSAFEDWYQQQPFATGPNKQLCRDSYAAGMGDPLVTYAAPIVAQPVQEPLTDEQIEKLRDKTFIDSKSMRKAVRAAEHAHGIGVNT